MGTFHDAVPPDATFTREQLDALARADEPACSIGYGFARTCAPPSDQHGWRFRWIDRRGMGNHGRLVLIPTDARTRAIAREGRVARIQMQLDCTHAEAEMFDRACRCSKHAREPDVVRAAWMLARVDREYLASAPPSGGGLGRWRDGLLYVSPRSAAISGELPSLSCPRLDSACTIARALVGVD